MTPPPRPSHSVSFQHTSVQKQAEVIIISTSRRFCLVRNVYGTIQLVNKPTHSKKKNFGLFSLCKMSKQVATITTARVCVIWPFGVLRLACLRYSLSVAYHEGLRPSRKAEYNVCKVYGYMEDPCHSSYLFSTVMT